MDDLISRQAAIDALDVLCQEHRYKIPGKGETYSQYNEAWQDALDRAEGAIFNLPSAQPEPLKIDLSGYSEEDWERLKKEWGNTPITVLSAQPEILACGEGELIVQPEIVRCKDCTHYDGEWCFENRHYLKDYDFCSRAERRTE